VRRQDRTPRRICYRNGACIEAVEDGRLAADLVADSTRTFRDIVTRIAGFA